MIKSDKISHIKSLSDFRNNIVGIDSHVHLLDGSLARYIFLDNAASTPTFQYVLNVLNDFMPFYSGVHRGTGFKALLATEAFDEAHRIAGDFVNADLKRNVVIFGKNTTEALNKIANRCDWKEDDVVITTFMEHHSNDLPWRKHTKVIHIGVDDTGYIDMNEMRDAFRQYHGHIRFLSVTGASNITGIVNPIHDLAELAHQNGAMIIIDAAQLAPHRAIDILPDDHPGHIDFISFAAHKMYAPFGTGVLIGPKDWFRRGEPDMVGGGVVDIVDIDNVIWTEPPAKEEAGSPNVPGAIALAASIQLLSSIGMEQIVKHEKHLLEYTLPRLRRIDGIEVYGPSQAQDIENKVGVICFNLKDVPHAKVASILNFEGGIGVRNGCFCAHPYVKRLLKISKEDSDEITREIIAGDRTRLPGMVRVSFGCYNTVEDIDRFIEIIERIAKGVYIGDYILNKRQGNYWPKDFKYNFGESFKHFSFEESENEPMLCEAS